MKKNEIQTKEDFLRFLTSLVDEKREQENLNSDDFGFIGEWANHTIPDFLDACGRWLDESEFSADEKNALTKVHWSLLAELIVAGKHYE